MSESVQCNLKYKSEGEIYIDPLGIGFRPTDNDEVLILPTGGEQPLPEGTQGCVTASFNGFSGTYLCLGGVENGRIHLQYRGDRGDGMLTGKIDTSLEGVFPVRGTADVFLNK